MAKFAANLSFLFQEHAFEDRFTVARANGFDAVECLYPYAMDAKLLADRLQENGQKLVLFNVPPGDWDNGERGLGALEGREAEFRSAVKTGVDYAKVTRTKLLHVMAGVADPADHAAMARYKDALRFAAECAGLEGMSITIEPLNPKDMPGYFLNDFQMAADIIYDLALPNLKLQFDIYHRQILNGEVMNGLRSLMPIIGHIQIAAAPHRHEPGSGEADDFAILRALDELGYEGHVGCEYRPAAGTVAGLGWIKRFGV